MKRRTILIVMDGWALRDAEDGNAVKQAATPVFDRIWAEFPHTTLDPHGTAVGLPEGQMGNSEVGHLNLGAGRVVHQDIVRISKSIETGAFFESEALLSAFDSIRSGGRLHLLGLVSDGGVHSHQEHLFALVEMARRRGVRDVFVHAVMDGRDTPPTGGRQYLTLLEEQLARQGIGKIATVVGRYYCMDRDRRWDRTQRAYDMLTKGVGSKTRDGVEAIQKSYDNGVTDEFVEPIVVVDESGKAIGNISDGDALVFFNFRADRARQITMALTDPSFAGFDRDVFPKFDVVCMTQYDKRFNLPVVFPPVTLTNILAEVSAAARMTNLRIAETEKYAHVTYFFNGGNEVEYPGEERILIPSPKVPTYDMKPEMSAFEVADTLVKVLGENRHDYVICNFANPDMVGHTGVIQAAVKAIETVDTCVGRVLESLDLDRDVAIVTSDHGNAEMMIDKTNGGPHTAHTTNPVPCVLVDRHYNGPLIRDGSLRDVAPTICGYLGIDTPEEMTGRDLRISG
ncbi:MAG: 2,3-bisphosphoglycerate-independent phosphoglycerate mutase [Candidatus Latescibacterota bacterium]|nr:MAG: 2,3-bisphosphoglycerate-independent phosphoglycerate mutase [Candidatus Latescibacterota bacterium]